MKIISYNVNGIRAAIAKGFLDWLKSASPDVLCLQEIKATESQIATERAALAALGYPYQYYYSAEKKGYSGVAILCKEQPKHVEVGTGIDYMDKEGRVLRADFENVSVMSLYLPSGTNPERLGFKFTFMDDFKRYIDHLKKSIPNLVICGDYNICHQAIDIHDPVRNATVSGFLPEERAWLDAFIKSGFIDTFRYFNPEPHNYSWWSYRANARANNKGWRIDYLLASEPLKPRLTRGVILPEAKHSDHCPVLLELT
ncbi:exodeoxyribonuclease III [Capnocytophaga haemolytica]|jgi:exodeoxyribonuclease III